MAEIGIVLCIGGSLVGLLFLLWSFFIEVDNEGLTLRLHGVTTRLPWESIEALTVTKVGKSWRAPDLMIRLAPGVRLRRRFFTEHDGRRTYTLLCLEDFIRAPEEVIAVVQQYGREKVDAEQYLQYRASKRAISQYIAEQRSIRGKESHRGRDKGPP